MNEPVNCAVCEKESPEYEKSTELDKLGWVIDILRGTENSMLPEIRILCPRCNKKRSKQKGLEITQEGNLFLENQELKKQLAKIREARADLSFHITARDNIKNYKEFWIIVGKILKGKSK